MYKLTIVILIFFSGNLIGQDIPVKKLIEIIGCHQFDCFNDIAIDYDFSFGKTEEDANGTAYLYESDRKVTATSNSKVRLGNSLSIFTNDGEIFLMHSSCSKKSYLLWKSELETLGLVKYKTEPYDGGLVEFYIEAENLSYMIKVVSKSRNDGMNDYMNYCLLIQNR